MSVYNCVLQSSGVSLLTGTHKMKHRQIRLNILNTQPLSLSVSVLQLMQQQALVAQSAYLSPVATVAAVQMQQLAALNPSSIIATPIASITPSSGNERQRCLAPAGLD